MLASIDQPGMKEAILHVLTESLLLGVSLRGVGQGVLAMEDLDATGRCSALRDSVVRASPQPFPKEARLLKLIRVQSERNCEARTSQRQ